MQTREIHLVRRPVGVPDGSELRPVEVEVPEPGRGEVLVRNRLFAVAAATAPLLTGPLPPLPAYEIGQPLTGKAVGEVVAVVDAPVPVGATVVHPWGWRDHAVGPADRVRVIDSDDSVVVLSGGLTAYAALRLADLRPGETVYVSSAAGAVGSLAAPLARILGAGQVIGGTRGRRGSGFDALVSYATPPTGVDVYVDLVGGDHLGQVIAGLNPGGRVILVGALAEQLGGADPARLDLPLIIGRSLSLRGLLTGAHAHLEPEWLALRREYGIEVPHTLVDGLPSAPAALVDLVAGRSAGTVLVALEP